MIVAAKNLEGGNGGQVVGQKLPVNRDDIGVGCRQSEVGKFGKVPSHLDHSRDGRRFVISATTAALL